MLPPVTTGMASLPGLGLRHWLLPCLESFPTGVISAETLPTTLRPHPTLLLTLIGGAFPALVLSSEHQPPSGVKPMLPRGSGSVCFVHVEPCLVQSVNSHGNTLEQ